MLKSAASIKGTTALIHLSANLVVPPDKLPKLASFVVLYMSSSSFPSIVLVVILFDII